MSACFAWGLAPFSLLVYMHQPTLLPLPAPFPGVRWSTHSDVSRSVLRRAHSRIGWQSWANEGVNIVNQLNGSSSCPGSRPTRAQSAALSQVCNEYREMGKPPPSLTPPGAFKELCHDSLPYISDGGGPASYQQSKLSLPDVGGSPVSPEDLLPEVHSNTIRGQGAPLLRSAGDATAAIVDSGLQKPHLDPAFHNPHTYAQFLLDLHARDLVEWQCGGQSLLGVFFVHKRDGRLRVIFDTRMVNCYFQDPPKTRLPTSAAFTHIETLPDQQIYFGGGDIENAFYRIQAPQAVKSFFTLPGIRARYLGKCCLGSDVVDPDSIIVPRLRVLPMGWSWSLWICQMVHEQMGIESEQSDVDKIVDQSPPPPLQSHNILHAKYVDNFLVMSHNPAEVERSCNTLTNKLNSHQLRVHECFGPVTSCSFVGLEFDGLKHTVRVSKRRTWRLALAIDHILNLSEVSGKTLEHILGHYTWAGLVRREALALVQACYSFIHAYRDQRAPLWDSVRRELRWMRSILPLLVASLDSQWSETVTCSDSSHLGFGVCETTWDRELVRDVGSIAERWRFRFEDHIAARKSALLSLPRPS